MDDKSHTHNNKKASANSVASKVPITTVRQMARTSRPMHGVYQHFQSGDIVDDRYQLEDILGQGGMGAVFSASDLEKKKGGKANPTIAIKLLTGDFQHHPQALQTFEREAEKTRALSHPNIVRVYEFDSADTVVYLTMERLIGNALIDIIRNKKINDLSYDSRIVILKDTASALHYAHTQGIVHSDLKPANLFLTCDNTIKVLDFGIARAINDDGVAEGFDADQLGALTLSYASPEMIRSEAPHPSDDIYALGIIMCELFGGQHPFQEHDAIYAEKNGLIPKLPKSFNHTLASLCHQCLTFQRDQRLESAALFVDALNNA